MNVVYIRSKIFTPEDAKAFLDRERGDHAEDLTYELRPAEISTRTSDTSLLVAIIGAAGTSVAALIAGLLSLAKSSGGNTITLQSKNGSKVEIRTNASLEEVRRVASIVREFELHSCTVDFEIDAGDGPPTLPEREN